MAKAVKTTKVAEPTPSAVTTTSVPQEFLDHAGKGNEGITSEDVTTPFLAIVQSNSPQRKKQNAKYIEGAEEGDLFITVGGALFNSVLVVPCAFQARWVEWKPRDAGGGFVRAFDLGERPVGARKGDIYVKLPNGNDAVKHHYHYVLILDDDEHTAAPFPVIIAMKSTDMKVSGDWNARILGAKIPGSGQSYPRYAQKWRLGTAERTNEKGEWFGFTSLPEGVLDLGQPYDASVWQAAVEFHNLVAGGSVEVKYDAMPGTEQDTEGSSGTTRHPDASTDTTPF